MPLETIVSLREVWEGAIVAARDGQKPPGSGDAQEPSKGALPPGTTFGRYRIERLLGEGGMGTVYLAQDELLHRPVALKVPKLESGDTVNRTRFLREAQVAGALRHANICPVFDVAETDGVLYLTMAYIEGKELSAYCQAGKLLSQRQAASLVRKLALALETAHAAGIVHRDLKPENVMIDKSGTPIIMDFGLARAHDEASQARLTQQGVVLGSPTYMSPEQADGRPERIGPPTDIYSLGVVLYEMLTGTVPFKGSVVVILSKLLTKAPPRPRDARSDLDPGLEAICLRMMAKKIHERYATMSDVAAALGSWLEKHPESVAARAASSGGPAEIATPAPAPVVAPAPAAVNDSSSGKPEKESSGLLVKAVTGVFVTVIAPVAVAFGIKYADVIIASLKAKFETPAAVSKEKGDEKDAAGKTGDEKKNSGDSSGEAAKPDTPRTIARYNEPAFRQWMKEVAAKPADEQATAVGEKLKELNPDFDGTITGPKKLQKNNRSKNSPRIENGVVTEIGFVAENVTDISPVRALSGLKVLVFSSRLMGKSQLSDLSPLRGLPLTSLTCNWTQVSDLSPLHECVGLTYLNVKQTRVTAAEVEALQKALPDCKVDCDELARPAAPSKP